ncbi:uncharacterized protein LOC122530440 [Frieseomelitta varia]|uniref:uncharacterized protein LOC122530440 n=1 Tax=Frieseomelitta varia TaxID=561572 RepID=UPI001CB69F05|nr:uncharacterized protein LOC122530440 [Frieseomelitta varia]
MNEKVKDVFLLNERVFEIFDSWPLRKRYTRFIMYMSYLSVHMVIMYMDLIESFGNLKSMVENIIDTTLATVTYYFLFLLRFNKLIEQAIVTVKQEMTTCKFETLEEMRLYLAYHKISDKFGRYAISTTLVIATLWYLTPMLHLLKPQSGQSNGSSSDYKLPFRVHAFLDYQNDLQNFVIMYLYQFPLVFLALNHISAISTLINLVLHICGKFSILSYRIRNIPTNVNVHLDNVIEEFVVAHIKLTTTVNSINSAFQIFLLLELSQTSIRMAVLIYMMLLNPSGSFIFHIQSTKVSEAFYITDWNDLSVRNQKLFLLAMSVGRRTLHVTAGKFYIFSLNGFIGIMKTSFGYVSLLRALI